MTSLDNKGFIDGFIGNKLFGWHIADEGVQVAIRIDGLHVLHLDNVDIEREDVREAYGLEHSRHGFEIELPVRFFDGASKAVELLSMTNDTLEVVYEQEMEFENIGVSSAQLAIEGRRAAVVCWDLGHNPAGRALVLYDILSKTYDHVDLIGPLLPRFGDRVWAPLRNLKNLNIITRPVADFLQLESFSEEVSRVKYDFIWICKPRFPSLFIGLTMQENSGCSVALDIDDYEMSFFKDRNKKVLARDILGALKDDKLHLADFDATVLAHRFIDYFALRTVSNVALQRTFGGEIVMHTRSEDVFYPGNLSKYKLFSRLKFLKKSQLDFLKKSQFDFLKKGNVVIFIGTIRRHKGILEVAEAVAREKSQNTYLLVAGSYESEELKKEIKAIAGDRVVMLGGVPFGVLPQYLALGDLICLPQDEKSETSYYQLPAKVADGLLMGLKVIVNDLPPYDGLHNEPGIFIRRSDEKLDEAMSRAFASPVSKDEIRKNCLDRFSSEKLALRTSFYFSSIDQSDVLHKPGELFKGILGRPKKLEKPVFRSALAKSETRDLVVLWKQQDSGLFGRRVDMVAKYLLKAGAFDRVIMFDAPLSVWEVNRLSKKAAFNSLSSSRLVYDAFVTRYLGKADEPDFIRRSFAYSNDAEHYLGHRLTSYDQLSQRFEHVFEQIGLSSDATLWACPVVPHFEQVLEVAQFGTIIADLIDDEREFASDPVMRRNKQGNYASVLGRANMVFTNNETMAKRFSGFSPASIKVVPNGVEKVNFNKKEILRIEGLPGNTRLIGYLGNLRDRIDLDIIQALAEANEKWHIILVGPTGEVPEIEQLNDHKRITLTGAMSYEESRLIAAGFDVAIIPHKLTKLTESMNPLKFFLYRELGLPIVTTPIKNLGKMDDMVFEAKADDVKSFVKCVRKALKVKQQHQGVVTRKSLLPENEYWQARIEQIIEELNS